jgi:hypothetical protein
MKAPGSGPGAFLSGPRGLRGFHEFSVQHLGAERAALRNILVLRPGACAGSAGCCSSAPCTTRRSGRAWTAPSAH